ncbi:DsbA family oxidoreductase [Pseudogemmobacter humi]|uniref:DSBA-like thioredoxin domain protein n=1 Tax=Pseudogemmobacter humi TaxID=2483812 RepID=A0A3P5XAX6_9RHOB|nr:DsbA family oxidoreductase [Pseudogemmobacter humi]VDC31922.1 DSBA-like thioredoxin domain protein [Pseudogemmobacter humi]
MTSPAPRLPVRLDIFSDPVCPWCHVGKLNLDRALADHPGHPFQVEWHPFQLNPDMPPGGLGKRAWLEQKFGGKERVDAVHERLREAARAAGVELDPDRPARIPNTLDAHRLIHWAGIEHRQNEIVTALFRAYWDEGRDIGEHATLADIAADNGMERDAVLRLLASEADASDLIARDQDARQKGVTSVPTFLIARHYVVTGAQPPELWADVIKDLNKTDS